MTLMLLMCPVISHAKDLALARTWDWQRSLDLFFHKLVDRMQASLFGWKNRSRKTRIRIDALVSRRAHCRKARRYEEADLIQRELTNYGIQCIDWPKVSWKWKDEIGVGDRERVKIIELANDAYNADKEEDIDLIVERAVKHGRDSLRRTGRQVVDCAARFALAGVKSNVLFLLLENIAFEELQRIGHRASMSPGDLCRFCEALAISGVRRQRVYKLAGDLLATKTDAADYMEAKRSLRSGHFGIWSSDRVRIGLRCRTSVGRPSGIAKYAFQNCRQLITDKPDIPSHFLASEDDRTLFVDLGCGYGLSLLGLATLKSNSRGYKLLGCEVNSHAVKYLRSIASRWDLEASLQVSQRDAQSCLTDLSHQSVDVEWISINFPTPYSISDEAGNRELPSKESFLVTKDLVHLAYELLRKPSSKSNATSTASGHLYIQTQCADVAMYIRKLCEDAGFVVLENPRDATRAFDPGSERDEEGDGEWAPAPDTALALRDQRAGFTSPNQLPSGNGWLKTSALPAQGRTEAEALFELENRPIYRILFRILIPPITKSE